MMAGRPSLLSRAIDGRHPHSSTLHTLPPPRCAKSHASQNGCCLVSDGAISHEQTTLVAGHMPDTSERVSHPAPLHPVCLPEYRGAPRVVHSRSAHV